MYEREEEKGAVASNTAVLTHVPSSAGVLALADNAALAMGVPRVHRHMLPPRPVPLSCLHRVTLLSLPDGVRKPVAAAVFLPQQLRMFFPRLLLLNISHSRGLRRPGARGRGLSRLGVCVAGQNARRLIRAHASVFLAFLCAAASHVYFYSSALQGVYLPSL